MKRSVLALLPLALGLTACESSSRFDGMFVSQPQPIAAAPMAPEPGIAAPTAPVTAQPLPPVAGAPLAPGTAPPGTDPMAAASANTTLAPGVPPAAAPGAPSAPAPTATASTTPSAPAPQPSARGLAGSWKISDAARGDCAIALTQQNLLDLYRASPAGCQAGSLAKVNAWQQRGQEIVLIEPGGRTAVRLFPKGDGTYEGAATTSGAIIRMSR